MSLLRPCKPKKCSSNWAQRWDQREEFAQRRTEIDAFTPHDWLQMLEHRGSYLIGDIGRPRLGYAHSREKTCSIQHCEQYCGWHIWKAGWHWVVWIPINVSKGLVDSCSDTIHIVRGACNQMQGFIWELRRVGDLILADRRFSCLFWMVPWDGHMFPLIGF